MLKPQQDELILAYKSAPNLSLAKYIAKNIKRLSKDDEFLNLEPSSLYQIFDQCDEMEPDDVASIIYNVTRVQNLNVKEALSHFRTDYEKVANEISKYGSIFHRKTSCSSISDPYIVRMNRLELQMENVSMRLRDIEENRDGCVNNSFKQLEDLVTEKFNELKNRINQVEDIKNEVNQMQVELVKRSCENYVDKQIQDFRSHVNQSIAEQINNIQASLDKRATGKFEEEVYPKLDSISNKINNISPRLLDLETKFKKHVSNIIVHRDEEEDSDLDKTVASLKSSFEMYKHQLEDISQILDGEVQNNLINREMITSLSNDINQTKNGASSQFVKSVLSSKTTKKRKVKNDIFDLFDKGEIETIKNLIDQNPSLINEKRYDLGYTLLHYGAENGFKDFCDYLVSKGAEINSLNYIGKTPYNLASEKGFSDICDSLTLKGASRRGVC